MPSDNSSPPGSSFWDNLKNRINDMELPNLQGLANTLKKAEETARKNLKNQQDWYKGWDLMEAAKEQKEEAREQPDREPRSTPAEPIELDESLVEDETRAEERLEAESGGGEDYLDEEEYLEEDGYGRHEYAESKDPPPAEPVEAEAMAAEPSDEEPLEDEPIEDEPVDDEPIEAEPGEVIALTEKVVPEKKVPSPSPFRPSSRDRRDWNRGDKKKPFDPPPVNKRFADRRSSVKGRAMKTRVCSNCHAEILAVSSICPHCGSRVRSGMAGLIWLLVIFFGLVIFFVWGISHFLQEPVATSSKESPAKQGETYPPQDREQAKAEPAPARKAEENKASAEPGQAKAGPEQAKAEPKPGGSVAAPAKKPETARKVAEDSPGPVRTGAGPGLEIADLQPLFNNNWGI